MVKVLVVRQALVGVISGVAVVAGGLVLGSSAAQAKGSGAGGFSMPSFSPTQPPDTGAVSTVMGWLTWGGLAVCVLGLILAGAKMGVDHRRGGGGVEHASAVGFVLGGAILIGAASSVIGALG